MKRLAFLALAACVSSVWGQGLLRNSGFAELAEGGNWPVAWECAAGRELYGCVNTDGLGSNDSLRYVADAAGMAVQPVTQRFECEPNTDYVLVAALKGDGTTQPQVVLNADGVKSFVARLRSASAKWERLRTTFNSGAARAFEVQLFGDVSMATTSRSVAGMASFDGVQVYRADQEPQETAPAAPFVAPGPNIALGKPYTFKPRPNYTYCTDPNDKTQLTDGVYTVGYFWTQETTVGFTRANPAIFTIDLGKREPIAGLSFNTAAGVAGVTWPEAIFVLVSDDGKSWRCLDDVVSLSMKHGLPPVGKYAVHRFATGELVGCGRYVQVMVAQTPYCFVDEIEVYRGKDAWLAEPPAGTPVDSAEDFFRQTKTVGGIRWRLQSDLATVRAAIGDLPLEPTLARAEELAAEIDALPKDVPEGFRTTLPLNRLHADIYSLNATVLRTRGFRGLSAWKADRWAPLQPLDSPEAPTEDVPSLRVELMCGEVRGTAVNLLNATDEAQDVTIEIQGFPAALSIRVLDVVFTDTRSRIPIAAALSDPRHTAEGPFVTVPAGCCKQIWLSVERPARPLEGEHQGTVRLKHGEWLAEMPLTISVADLSFPEQPTMSFGGWDYTNGNAGYYKAPGNVTQLVPMLREYYVDTPWATVAVAPKGAEFDEGGALTNPDRLDFANWDEWVERWSGVRNYYVFLSYKDSFHGEKMGTPRFNRMVGQYFTAWVEHMAEQGLEPHQLGVLILDEPHDNAQDEIIVAYARAIRAAQPEIDIFEDPTYRDPTKGVPAMFEASTTLCPNTPMMIAQGGAFREFYEAQRKGGRRLWLYSCSGPAKLLDPLNYHRGQMWWAMRIGATGTFYWALGCGGGIGDSWNAYAQTGVEYAPFFVSPASVTRGKHMEAIREGIQDYEYYVMLRARVRALAARGVPEAKLARARKMLAELPVQVTDAIDSGSLTWSAPKDRGLMDRTRLELLRELVALQ